MAGDAEQKSEAAERLQSDGRTTSEYEVCKCQPILAATPVEIKGGIYQA